MPGRYPSLTGAVIAFDSRFEIQAYYSPRFVLMKHFNYGPVFLGIISHLKCRRGQIPPSCSRTSRAQTAGLRLRGTCCRWRSTVVNDTSSGVGLLGPNSHMLLSSYVNLFKPVFSSLKWVEQVLNPLSAPLRPNVFLNSESLFRKTM